MKEEIFEVPLPPPPIEEFDPEFELEIDPEFEPEPEPEPEEEEHNIIQGTDGNDILMGIAGANDFYPEAGVDMMIGGEGVDYFILTELGLGADRDVIANFNQGGGAYNLFEGDKIDVSGLGSGLWVLDNDPFNLLAIDHIVWWNDGVDTFIAFDSQDDSDMAADYEIVLNGVIDLSINDFFGVVDNSIEPIDATISLSSSSPVMHVGSPGDDFFTYNGDTQYLEAAGGPSHNIWGDTGYDTLGLTFTSSVTTLNLSLALDPSNPHIQDIEHFILGNGENTSVNHTVRFRAGDLLAMNTSFGGNFDGNIRVFFEGGESSFGSHTVDMDVANDFTLVGQEEYNEKSYDVYQDNNDPFVLAYVDQALNVL